MALSHTEWKEETVNLLNEIGIEDYAFDTEHSFRINHLDVGKLKPISRKLNIGEKLMIGCINEQFRVILPYESATLC